MKTPERTPEITLPKDPYSKRLRELRGHPEGIEKTSYVEVADDYGNIETYAVKTVWHDGRAVVFVEHGTATGGTRWMLPEKATAALFAQRDAITRTNVSRRAKKAAATRKLAGVEPFKRKA